MTKTAAALTLLGLLALAAGCASLSGELQDLRSAKQDDRVDAALDLALGVAERDPEHVAARGEIVLELRRLLDDRSALVRQVAVESLAGVEGRTSAGAIADRLRDRDPWVRFTAARQLGHMAVTAVADPLSDALRKDDSPDVRRAAAQALAKLGARSALRDLYLALQDDARGVRYNAYLALVKIVGTDRGEDPRAWRDALPRGAGE